MTVTPSLTNSPRKDVRTPPTQSDELDQDEIRRIEKGAPDGKRFESLYAPKSWHTDSNESRHERDLIYRNVSIDIFPNEPELLQSIGLNLKSKSQPCAPEERAFQALSNSLLGPLAGN